MYTCSHVCLADLLDCTNSGLVVQIQMCWISPGLELTRRCAEERQILNQIILSISITACRIWLELPRCSPPKLTNQSAPTRCYGGAQSCEESQGRAPKLTPRGVVSEEYILGATARLLHLPFFSPFHNTSSPRLQLCSLSCNPSSTGKQEP